MALFFKKKLVLLITRVCTYSIIIQTSKSAKDAVCRNDDVYLALPRNIKYDMLQASEGILNLINSINSSKY